MFSFRLGNKHKGFIIRALSKKDVFHLARMRNEIDADSDFMMASDGERKETGKAAHKKFLKDPRQTVFVGLHDGRLAGYIALQRSLLKKTNHNAYLTVGVHTHHRGKGIGTKLMEKAEEWAKTAGIERIELEVFDHNPAKHLYTRLGYEEEGRRKGAARFKDGDKDIVLMAKRLK